MGGQRILAQASSENRKPLLNAVVPDMNASWGNFIQTEDQYVTLQRYIHDGLSFEAQEFLLPFWKRESNLYDMLPKLETCRLLIVLYRSAGIQRLELIPSIIAKGHPAVARNNFTSILSLVKTSKTFETVGFRLRDKLFRKLREVSRLEKTMLGQSTEFYSRLGLTREKVQDYFIKLYRKILNSLDEYSYSVKEVEYQHAEFAEKYTQPLMEFLMETDTDLAYAT